jgi:hypothetical protein
MSKEKKFGKDLNELGSSKLSATVTCSGFGVFAISGQIIDEDDHGITLRYKKDKGRSVYREHFALNSVVAVHRKGDRAIVWAKLNRALFVEQGGRVTNLPNGFVQIVTVTGEILQVNPSNNSGFETSVKMEEDLEFTGSPKTKSPKRTVESDDEDDEPVKKLSRKERKATRSKD